MSTLELLTQNYLSGKMSEAGYLAAVQAIARISTPVVNEPVQPESKPEQPAANDNENIVNLHGLHPTGKLIAIGQVAVNRYGKLSPALMYRLTYECTKAGYLAGLSNEERTSFAVARDAEGKIILRETTDGRLMQWFFMDGNRFVYENGTLGRSKWAKNLGLPSPQDVIAAEHAMSNDTHFTPKTKASEKATKQPAAPKVQTVAKSSHKQTGTLSATFDAAKYSKLAIPGNEPEQVKASNGSKVLNGLTWKHGVWDQLVSDDLLSLGLTAEEQQRQASSIMAQIIAPGSGIEKPNGQLWYTLPYDVIIGYGKANNVTPKAKQ